MTLKYESEILFDLMKRDGDDAPSDVLPYESELKEKYLNQVVGAYPKLQDYRPEWLNYNLYHHLPSDFPVESVTNVTSASFHDVVPYAYGSATLKGNTLVNLLANNNVEITSSSSLKIEYVYQLDATKTYIIQYRVNQLPELSGSGDITRAFKFEWYNGSGVGGYVNIDTNNVLIGKNQYIKVEPYSGEISRTSFGLWCPNYVSGTLDIDIMIIEYIKGMENWDIPYFTGMQSVKMPVLTTTGKNLFDINSVSIKGNVAIKNNTITITPNGTWQNQAITTISVNCGESYVLSFNNGVDNSNTGSIKIYDGESVKNILIAQSTTGVAGGKVLKFTPNTNKIKVVIEQYGSDGIFIMSDIQIEKGSVATTYEPFKSNILTTNEEVELRKVGDVQDELNLSTGELTQRVGEVFSNSLRASDASSIGTYANVIPVNYPVNFLGWDNRNLICDKLKTINRADINWDKTSSINGISLQPTGFWFVVDKTITTQEQANEYLNNLNATIQYELPTTVIKTVDLTCINEQGENETLRPIEGTMHVNTSSQTLPPLLDMSVPVEATSQNLMSFANIVEEEK